MATKAGREGKEILSRTGPTVDNDDEGEIDRQRRLPDFGRRRLELNERVTYDLFSLREKRREEGRSKL